MTSPGHRSTKARRRHFAQRSAFTLVEVLVASSIGLVIVGGALVFMNNARVSVSGITAQTTVNYKAGQAIGFIQSRIRFATSISSDPSGNALTLGFDDNYEVDSDSDGKSYNDQDHLERFQFTGINGTNWATASSNSLIYTPRVGDAGTTVLLPSGVRNLPGNNIFTITNLTTAIIRFGVADNFGGDHFQSIDIQATGVSLNRPKTTNTISILP